MTWMAVGAVAAPVAGAVISSAMNSGSGNSPTTTTSGGSSGSNYSQSTYVPNEAAMPIYGFLAGNTAELMQQPAPFFPGQTYVSPSEATQQAVNMGMNGMPYYYGGANWLGASASLAPNAIAAQQGMLGTAGGNYDFLSNAADVANNPYVQDMLAANAQQVNQQLRENWLPAVNQGAASVNALGSSRQGIAQAQAIERAAQQLANTNASTMLNAYGQGLGAQSSALGQTGNMLQNLTAPMQTGAYAGSLSGQAGNMIQQGAQNALGWGQTTEGYQQAALNDAIARYNYQYEAPWINMQNAANMLQYLQPLGVTTRSGTDSTSQYETAPNPGYMSPFQSAMGGASLGYGLYDAWNQNQAPAASSMPNMGTVNSGGSTWYL
jgi:hypothetical protein